ncbi:hypothetical protein E2C01_070510 [Portunus trituberculatus]|uniref:Uncharacterized protein n=1 Tax=Portunus trituberculatus TaxID=210409 RepID=A0A5B7I1S9_PORTR|nr:hypothetical protein [Portunus trituberculatus]
MGKLRSPCPPSTPWTPSL